MSTNPFEKYLANDLADFAGLRISGTLPVKQEILNELLQTVLADLQKPSSGGPAKSSSSAPSSGAAFDPSSLLKYVNKAELRAETGRLVLDFDVSVDSPDK